MLGVGKRSAAILAEIGDAKRFSNGKQIVSWTGLAPSLHQSPGVCILGSITKQGNKWLRWNMVEVAHAAVRVRDSKFRALFMRVRAVSWHLLVNGEEYVEDGFERKVRLRKTVYGGHVPLEEMAEVLRSAGYTVVANG